MGYITKSFPENLLLTVITVLLFAWSPARADDTWDGGVGGDDLTSTGVNWVDDGAPAAGAPGTLTFGADQAGAGNHLVSIDVAYTNLTGFDFAGADGAYTISDGGGSLTFGAGASIINNASGFDHIINEALTSAGLTFNCVTDDLTIGGIIDGTTVIKSGDGILTLSGDNSYTGTTTLNAGTIILGHANALGTGAGAILTLGGAGALEATAAAPTVGNAIDLAANTLTFSGGNNAELSGIISSTGGGGSLTKAGASALTLSGTNTYAGGTTLNAGTIILGDNAALGTGTLTATANSALQSTASGRAVTNNIDIDNGVTLTVGGGGFNSTLSGVIADGTGAGTLAKSGAGTLTLSGTNTYTGGTTLNAGTLILGDDAALGTGTLTLGGAGALQSDDNSRVVSNLIANGGNALTISGASNLELSGVISGAGTLTKTGAGTLTLSGVNTYNGLTTLNGGTLNLTGQVGGALTLTTGTLTGAGTVAGNVTLNGGTFAPGNSIGTTTIGGNYVQNAGSTLEVEVEKTGSGALRSDFLDVTGTATLAAGSTVNVTDISAAGRIIGTGDTFTIIDADGGVTDNGATITDTSAVLSFSGAVSGNLYQLIAARDAFANNVSGGNRRSVLAAIDSDLGNATGDYITVINALTALNAAELSKAAEQLNPLPHASATQVSIVTMQTMADNFAGYLSGRRSGTASLLSTSSGSSPGHFLLADASSNPRALGEAIREHKKLAEEADEADRLRGFARPFGLFYDQDSTSKFVGFRAQAVGAQFGIDKNVTDTLVVGVGGGYAHSFIDYLESRGESDIDSFRLGPYATYYKDNYFVDTSVTFGYHNNETERRIRFGTISRTADSDYDAYDLSVYAGGGYDIELNNWTLTPKTSLQYISYHNESFKESGAGAAGLSVESSTTNSLRSKLGINLSTIVEFYETKVAPEIFVGWAHEFLDEEAAQSRFVNGAAQFTTDVDNERDDSVYFGAGLSALLSENTSGFVRYEGECFSGNQIDSLSVGVTVLF